MKGGKMRGKILFTLAFAIFTFSVISAQTTIPGGNVSGTWYKVNSPYNITGGLIIPANNTLIIEPGVQVNLQSYDLTVRGFLEAVGTKIDTIYFTSSTGGNTITFDGAQDSSHLIYCSISEGLICDNSDPVISHSRICGGISVTNSSYPSISHCTIKNYGIYISNTTTGEIIITGCTISNCINSGIYKVSDNTVTLIDCIIFNNSGYIGGGVRFYGGKLNLINCTVCNNKAPVKGAGGIMCQNSTVTLTNCTVNGNIAEHNDVWSAGGIHLYNCNSVLSYCSIHDNAAFIPGGGITTNGGNLTIDHCTIDGNWIGSLNDGEGIYISQSGSITKITNSIISNNTHTGSAIYNAGTLVIEHSDFYGNNGGNIKGTVPSGLGVLSNMNYNGDPCDVYNNIFLDPLFEDQSTGNLQITWTGFPTDDITKSPCIDAGDPEFASDRDSTITDMGRYFFDQSVPEIALSHSILDFGSVIIGEQADSVLKVYNTGLDTLVIDQLFNDDAVFSTDYNPADNIILPLDSISITVTFTPVNTSPVIDTIHIYNNDQDSIVKLTGTGQIPTSIFDLPDVIPQKYLLGEAYPNPFYQVTSFELDLPGRCYVILTIFNMSGDVVSTLISKEMEAGRYKYVWNSDNLASGTYLLKLQAGKFNEVKKIILLK
jgi:hypothetical protein